MGLREEILEGEWNPAIPVMGTGYFVKVMSGRASDKFDELIENKGTANSLIMATLVRYSMCDASGVLIFGDDDIEKLRDTQFPFLKRAFDKAMEVNAVSKDAVEGLEKN